MVTYWHKNERGALVVGVDTEGKAGIRSVRVRKPATLGIRSGNRYLLYRPDAEKLMEKGPVGAGRAGRLSARLAAWEPLLVYATAAKGRPQTVWATLSDGIEERWSGRNSSLTLSHKTQQGLVRFRALC